MSKVFQIQIQGNVPYNGNPIQNTMGGVPAINNPGYTSDRQLEVVTSSMRDALALATATLRPTEVITNIYERNVDVIIDPSCIPRG